MSAGVLAYLRHLLPLVNPQLSDGELLGRFTAAGDQAAFAELLRRHGPLVWGVCCRVLGDAHAAEDAFQATFLQLTQRAKTLRREGALAGWLHTVATRLARRAWLAEKRRRRRDHAHVPAMRTSADDRTWLELRQMLDAEIARLPKPYRQPLILCYLENLSQSETAHRLGLSPTVLRGRLERGRQKLRQRLEKLGLPLAAALLLSNADPVPAALGKTTLQTILLAQAGGPIPPAVATLAASAALISPLKVGVVAAVLLIVGGIGIGAASRRTEPPAAPPVSKPPAQVQRGVDALGDPLPPGALQRLGTRRHRIQNWPLPWQDMPDGKSYLAYHRLGNISAIRRLDAVTGRILESWRVPDLHQVAGFSPNGRYALMSTEFVFYSGIRVPGQKEEQEWRLTLYDLVKRKAVWVNSKPLEQKDWKHVFWTRFSADDRWIATTGGTGVGPLRLWDGATGKELWSHKPDVAHMVPLGFAEGGAILVVRAIDDNSIRLLDRVTGKQRRSFRTMDFRTTQEYDLSPDGSAVLFGSSSPSVRVWDVATGKERTPLQGHKKAARCFAFSRDGKTVVTGGNDPFVLVRDWPSGKAVRIIDLGRGGIERMAISGNGRRLEVLFWGEQALHFYDLITGKKARAPLEGHSGGIYGVAIAPDGALLSFSKDATIRTWDMKTGKAIGRLPVEQDLNAGGFALSRDGRLLATTNSAIDAILVYERATGKQIRKLPAERTVGKHLVFSPDGCWLAGADHSEGIIQVWDMTNGRTVLRGKHKVAYGITCTFSPDGYTFAASDHGIVRFWDVRTWKEQRGLKAFAPLGLAYSPDGRTLATAGVEGIRLYELATRRERVPIRPLGGYPEGVLRFSSTGRWLAWTSSPSAQRMEERLRWPPTGNISVWDIHRGEQLGSFTGHDDAITGLAFTADEHALVSSSADSTMLVWDIAGIAAKKPRPKAGDVDRAWQALAGDDAKAAYEAIRVLAASPDAAVKLLARHLKPVARIDTKRIEEFLRDLDSPVFADRERATTNLEQLGEQAVPGLKQFFANKPSLEARRRVEQILEKALSQNPQRLRQNRALEALEWMGGDSARRLIEALAKGAPNVRLTRDARAALGRMRR
ncbi:MAG TPA: sigma-70 family RNA polymerase sigma factor [Gemmataceae bacterium]|nr:sigma-70 family RNA polymerase sigma factor [Gemmataceae bacterium]